LRSVSNHPPERLLNEEITQGFFRRVIERAKPFMSDEHFTVDGTLIKAWASYKSFRRKDGKGNPPEAASRPWVTYSGVDSDCWQKYQS
jgi:hypothetical protein